MQEKRHLYSAMCQFDITTVKINITTLNLIATASFINLPSQRTLEDNSGTSTSVINT